MSFKPVATSFKLYKNGTETATVNSTSSVGALIWKGQQPQGMWDRRGGMGERMEGVMEESLVSQSA